MSPKICLSPPFFTRVGKYLFPRAYFNSKRALWGDTYSELSPLCSQPRVNICPGLLCRLIQRNKAHTLKKQLLPYFRPDQRMSRTSPSLPWLICLAFAWISGPLLMRSKLTTYWFLNEKVRKRLLSFKVCPYLPLCSQDESLRCTYSFVCRRRTSRVSSVHSSALDWLFNNTNTLSDHFYKRDTWRDELFIKGWNTWHITGQVFENTRSIDDCDSAYLLYCHSNLLLKFGTGLAMLGNFLACSLYCHWNWVCYFGRVLDTHGRPAGPRR